MLYCLVGQYKYKKKLLHTNCHIVDMMLKFISYVYIHSQFCSQRETLFHFGLLIREPLNKVWRRQRNSWLVVAGFFLLLLLYHYYIEISACVLLLSSLLKIAYIFFMYFSLWDEHTDYSVQCTWEFYDLLKMFSSSSCLLQFSTIFMKLWFFSSFLVVGQFLRFGGHLWWSFN